MKTELAIMVLMGYSFALSWQEFVSLPLEEKMLLQYENLKGVANGTFSTPYLTAAEAASMRTSFSENVVEYARAYPNDYNRAMANVRKLKVSIKPVAITYVEAKFVKVGDHYVSEAICKADPSACPAAPVNQTQAQNKTAPPNKRTAAECSAAREKDWGIYCWQNYPNVACDGVSAADKNMVLDNIAEGYYSNQAICLRGE